MSPSPRAEEQQRAQLHRLLNAASDTEWGRQYKFGELADYRSFSRQVPVMSPSRLHSLTETLKAGRGDVSWPGTVDRFAVSAGTSGKGRHLPVTRERLQSDRRFMRKLALSYLRRRPNLFRLTGPHLSLPGDIEWHGSYRTGEISAFSALEAPSWLKFFQVLRPEDAVNCSFGEKMQQVRERAESISPRVIISAPSWLLTLFRQVLDDTGASSLRELWPRLRLLVCGGVKLANYREHLARLVGPPPPDFLETYGASEGYFAYSDAPDLDELRLVTDNGIFYEFIPDPLPDAEAAGIQEALPVWKVEAGRPYGLVVSTNGGLWRWPVNDIVSFTSLDPPRIRVRGRVNEMLDDYGEALYLHEAEQALEGAAAELDVDPVPGPFTILACLPDGATAPRHRWYIRFGRLPHAGLLEKLSDAIDRRLRQANRHYATRRESGALDPPQIRSIRQADLTRWLEETGRHRAQGKLPRVIGKEDARILESP